MVGPAAASSSAPALAAHALHRTFLSLPVLSRSWAHSLSKQPFALVRRFVETAVRPSIHARESFLAAHGLEKGRWSPEELAVKPSVQAGEISATYIRDETRITMKMKFPQDFPLSHVEVECASKLGIPEVKWRRWVLQIVQLVSMQDGSAVDAVLRWKANLDKEFDGIEPCPVCYSVLHPKSAALPTLGCRTCKNRFHPLCLQTWFKTSGKLKCVVCQQPWE